jgi:uncharacterized protein YbjT (DUF2867 family)
MKTFLVIGGTGTVGAGVARRLEESGHGVRRASRRPDPAAGQVALDLVRGEGLEAALDGVDGVFMMSPPGQVEQDRLLAPVVDAARRAGVRKAVLMSAMGADADPQAPLRQAELHLERSGLAWNVVRPNWFMQNFNTFWLGGILGEDAILLPVGRARGSFIDARDIADVVAELLLRDEHAGQAFDLTGAESLDHDQVAAVLTRAAGRTIRYEDIAPERMRGILLGAGLAPAYAEFLLLILGFFKAGYAERITDAVARITGRPPRRFEDYARDHAAAWRR